VKRYARTAVIAGAVAIAVAIAALRGLVDPDYLSRLGAASCLAIGLCGGLGAALIGYGLRPTTLERALLVVGCGAIGLGVFTNHASARLIDAPDMLTEPSRSKYCLPEEKKTAPAPVAPAPPPEMAGCALVKRAYALGYTKSLGSCAPKAAAPAVPVEDAKKPPCELRQLDEPYLHYAWRRLADSAGSVADADLAESVSGRIDDMKTKLDHVESLIAHHEHAITGTPHASHHLWITLPDPRDASWLGDLLAPERCDARYARLPLWRTWTGATRSALVEHVIGQLLFSARFGTTRACRDYAIHWNAPADACTRLTKSPAAFLDEQDQLEPVRAVLDRRRRQIELRRLDEQLGRPSPVEEPPSPSTVVSFQCLVVDPAAARAVTGGDVVLDGETLSVREIRVPAVRVDGAGPIDVYADLAALLGGDGYAGPAAPTPERVVAGPPPDPSELGDPTFLLLRLERIHDIDPFLGVRWPLERPDVVDVYPFHRHLHAFVDAFRRRYHAQRGRL
jgi:hypothetical protein